LEIARRCGLLPLEPGHLRELTLQRVIENWIDDDAIPLRSQTPIRSFQFTGDQDKRMHRQWTKFRE
jgi:hypothetical protein